MSGTVTVPGNPLLPTTTLQFNPSQTLPDTGGLNQDALMGAVNITNQQLAASNRDAAAAAGSVSGAAGAVSADSQKAATYEGMIQTLNGAAKASQAAGDLDIATKWGFVGNGEAASAQAALSAQILASVPDLQAAQAHVKELQDQDFWSDPLAWLGNQISLPFAQAKANEAQDRIVTAFQTLGEMSKAAQEEHSENAYATQVDYKAVAAAATQKLLAQAAVVGDQAQMDAGRTALSAAQVQASTTQEQLGNALHMNDELQKTVELRQQQEMLAMKEKQDALDTILKNQSIEEGKYRIAGMQQTDASRVAITNGLAGLNTLVGSNITYPVYEASSQAQKDFYNQAMASTIGGQFGQTPAIALRTVTNLNLPAPNSPRENMLREQLMTESAKITADPLFKTLTTQGQVNTLNQDLISTDQRTQRAIPDSGYWASPMTITSMSNIKSLDGNILLQAMKPLAAADPTSIASGTNVLAMADNLVQSGKMDIRTAASMAAQLFSAQAAQVSADAGTMKYGMKGVSNETGYKQSVDIGALNYSKGIVDLTKPAALENILLRRQRRASLADSLGKGGTNAAVMGATP